MASDTSVKSRVKRFRRSEQPRAFQLTERDVSLLAHVARHRFLSSAHLASLDGGSEQNLRRCLRVLFDHGYLDRPRAQLNHVAVTGPRPIVYGLGRRGPEALRDHGHWISSGTDWTERNKRAGAKFIEHTLAIADFMVALEVALHGQHQIRLLRAEDIVARAPIETRSSREALRLVVPGLEARSGVSSVIADGLFGLVFPDQTAAYFLLEVDRGSMPVMRSHAGQTSFGRKLKVYWEVWKAGLHAKHFGVKQIRVLTITDSAKRVRTMLEAVDEMTEGKGSNFFLFADAAKLKTNSPLDIEWTSGKGLPVRLTD
jgi:hypothetical protein